MAIPEMWDLRLVHEVGVDIALQQYTKEVIKRVNKVKEECMQKVLVLYKLCSDAIELWFT